MVIWNDKFSSASVSLAIEINEKILLGGACL